MAVSTTKPITAEDIKNYLDARHNSVRFGTHESIGVPELTVGGGREERRLDYWAIECWQSKGFTKTAYEIKVSRSDWLSELKKPQKRRMGLFVSNYFYFIAPKGIVKKEELPIECGLMEVSWTDNQFEIDRYDDQMQLPESARIWQFKDWNHPVRPEYREFLTAGVTVNALWRDDALPTWRLVVNLCRKLSKPNGEAK